MKNILLILLFNYVAFSGTQLNFESLISDFNGLTFNQNTVIAYGNCGIILRSSDLGRSWEQQKIANDSTVIKRIKSYKGNFYGIVDNGTILTSTDDGRNWQSLSFPRHFYDLDISGDKLYVLSDSTLLIFDLELNQTEEFKFSLNIKPTEFVVEQNHFIIPSDTNKINIYDLKDKKILGVFDFKQSGFTTTGLIPKRLLRNEGSIYLYTGESIAASIDGGLNWEKSSGGTSMYNLHQNTIYSLNPKVYDYLNLLTTPILSKNTQPGFTVVTTGTTRRYVKNQPFSDFAFLNDEIIIGVGSNKTIYRSSNKGISWDLTSHIPSVSLSYWRDKNYGAVFNGNGQVLITKNGGTTWLPQIYNDSNAGKYSMADLMYLSEDGKCFIFKAGINMASNTNIMLSNDSGNTFKQVLDNSLNENSLWDKSFIIKNKENYLMYLNSKLLTLYCRLYILDKNLKLKEMVLASDSCNILEETFQFKDGKFSAIAYQRMNPTILLKDTLQLWKFSSIDGIKWEKDYLATIRGRIYHVRQLDNNNMLFLMQSFSDSMVTDTNGHSEPKYDFYYALLYNSQLKNFDTIFNKKLNGFFFSSFIHDGKLWIMDLKSMYNIDINNLTSFKWDSMLTSPYDFPTNLTNINNEVLFLDYFSKLRKRTIVKITLSDKTNIDEKIEVRTQIYTYPPYPIPASDKIKCKIYWDTRFDVADSKFIVHDVNGNLIKTVGKIILNRQQSYCGEMAWDCSCVPNGIYFISFTHGDITKVIPVVINR